MESIFNESLRSLADIRPGVWLLVLAYALLMCAVYIFGIPFKRRNAVIDEKNVSHGIVSTLERVKVYDMWWTEANVITGLGAVGLLFMIYQSATNVATATIPVLFLVAAVLSDLLDGEACKRHECHSHIGAILDPLRDRLAGIAVIFALGFGLGLTPTWIMPLLFVVFFEVKIGQVALAARREGKTLNSHGAGEKRQIVHLIAVETILTSVYVVTPPIPAMQLVACVGLCTMSIASFIAYMNYRDIYVEHTYHEV
jgi:phosphatidylglycerophosphate synthase